MSGGVVQGPHTARDYPPSSQIFLTVKENTQPGAVLLAPSASLTVVSSPGGLGQRARLLLPCWIGKQISYTTRKMGGKAFF